MSWDIKALAVLVLTWAGTAVIYLTAMDMPAGTRAWAAGAALFLVMTLVVWRAERRGARRASAGEGARDAD